MQTCGRSSFVLQESMLIIPRAFYFKWQGHTAFFFFFLDFPISFAMRACCHWDVWRIIWLNFTFTMFVLLHNSTCLCLSLGAISLVCTTSSLGAVYSWSSFRSHHGLWIYWDSGITNILSLSSVKLHLNFCNLT